MALARRNLALVVVLGVACLPAAIAHKKPSVSPSNERARAIQTLNRLTFGPRPGDVDRVLAIGVDKWIDQQLHPDSIHDHAVETRLAQYRTLKMSSQELAKNFPPPAVIRQVADGKQQIPRNQETRAIYETQLVRYREKQENKSAGANQPEMQPSSEMAAKLPDMLRLAPDLRMQTLLNMAPEDRSGLLATIKGNTREEFLAGMSPEQRENVLAMYNPQQVVAEELMQAKIIRATYSERQLEEVMTDFWMNHFNVFIGKGADHYELTSYERDVIRSRALGKFEDLLVATAQSPAMLFYLDNWLSVGPDSDFAQGIRRDRRGRLRFPPQRAKRQQSGLNENYGRELMELHTLGVNGGYTQKDVTEVAKVFTGWTLKEPRQGGGFFFDERKHEPGTKIVLGHKIKENGEDEGREVLRILARNPATAKFVCNKLAMRFVADNPPPALVDRMAKAFLKKNGDIREVLRTMLASPEFWSQDAYRAKVKTPLEFVVSSLRATDAQVDDALPLVRQLQALGMPLYGAQPPTGYSMKAEAWVSSAGLLGRMNFAVRVASGRVRGVQIEPPSENAAPDFSDPDRILTSLESSLLEGDVSKQTHETIAAQLNDPQISQRRLDDPVRSPDVAMIEGLLLGSPEFQRR
ncbi:MAG TPA: DUF1800 domain-containing protein [Terriglobales bacterium]|nr:DUF1800 domain-containing protein [Terriglobales bacterium]